MEWLRLVKKYYRNNLTIKIQFFGESHEWSVSIDFDIRWNKTLKEFEKHF
jgi:hypothetical protein